MVGGEALLLACAGAGSDGGSVLARGGHLLEERGGKLVQIGSVPLHDEDRVAGGAFGVATGVAGVLASVGGSRGLDAVVAENLLRLLLDLRGTEDNDRAGKGRDRVENPVAANHSDADNVQVEYG